MKKIFLVIILVIAILGIYFVAKGPENNQASKVNPPEENPAPTNPNMSNNTNTSNESSISSASNVYEIQGMKVEVLKEGTGEGAKNSDRVTVHYVGTFKNGSEFDSSVGRGIPFSFTLGVGQVIRGWDLGVLGMKVGEKRRLTIPAELAYGETGTPGGPIPSNATLVFEVELLGINQ